ncbi:MAG: hypothetical protein OER43_00745 [Gammaproteobacteria bacterium]|nr:hypothetical protein [Gammaproteobacteria bacterium]MDH3412860.1 hypothetical protein [Gammaproteobacteria bacterium]
MPQLDFCTAQGLHGLQGFFFGAQGLHGLQDFFAAQGLQGLQAFRAAHGLHGLHGFFAAHGLCLNVFCSSMVYAARAASSFEFHGSVFDCIGTSRQNWAISSA